MSGLIEVTVQEARGSVAIPADLDRLAIVFGNSTLGSGLSPFFLSGASAQSALGYGDGVDCMTQIIEQRAANGPKFPAAMYTLPPDTLGAYGTIDLTNVTGTSLPEVNTATNPVGTFEAGIRSIVGWTNGTTGGSYQYTLDGGRNWSVTKSLGTAVTITVPNVGVAFLLEPPDDALVAAATEARADALAHFANVVAHDASDTAAIAIIALGVPTTNAQAWALLNQIATAYASHRVNTSAHNSADSTNIVTAPTATSGQTGITLFVDYKAKYNAHLANAVAHNSADSTNTIAATTPLRGTIVAGDSWTVRTLAPTPAAADVDAAFVALAASTTDVALVFCDFPCDASMIAHLTTGADVLAAVGKIVTIIARSRLPNFETSETEIAWGAAIETVYVNSVDSRVAVETRYGLLTDALTSRRYLRSGLAQVAAEIVRVSRSTYANSPSDRAMVNFSLVDDSGTTVGHDEGPRGVFTGLSSETMGNRLCACERLANPQRREDVFATFPWVLYDDDERIQSLPVRRLANAIKRVAVGASIPKLGGKAFFVSTGPSTGTLTAPSRNAIQGSIYDAIKSEFEFEIENASDAAIDSGLVQVSPSVTVSAGPKLSVSVTIAPRIAGYVTRIELTLAIKE